MMNACAPSAGRPLPPSATATRLPHPQLCLSLGVMVAPFGTPLYSEGRLCSSELVGPVVQTWAGFAWLAWLGLGGCLGWPGLAPCGAPKAPHGSAKRCPPPKAARSAAPSDRPKSAERRRRDRLGSQGSC